MHELESHATFYIHQKVLKHPNVASVYIKALEHMHSVTHTSPSSEDLIIINSYRRTRMHTNIHAQAHWNVRTIQHYFMYALDVYACGIAVQETRSLSLTTRSANVWWFVFMCTQLYLSVKEKTPCYGQSPSSSALILALNCVLFVSSFFLGHTQTYYTEIRRCGVCYAMLCAYVSVKYQQISKGTTFRHSKQTKSVCIEQITWRDVCEAQLRKRATITLLNFKRIKRFVIKRRK